MNDRRDPDAQVDRLLKHAWKQPPSHATTDACLDAETMAAWVDGGLVGDALMLAESHVADCARCQAVAAALARTEPAEAPATEHARPSRQWLGWLVPVAAAVAALAIWINVRPTSTTSPAPASAPPPQMADSRLNKQEAQSRAVPPADAPKEQLKKGPRDLTAEVARRDRAQDAAAKRDADKADKNVGDRAAQTAEPKQALGANRSAPPVTAAPPPAAATPQPAQPAARQEAFAQALAPREIPSRLDPTIRWRVQGSSVERSTDGGKTWVAQPIGIEGADLTAGSSPAPSTCWLVGRRGVVLVQADGQTWRRVSFPEATDLSGVLAADALRATVTTADGRSFTTTDGGVTWVRRAPDGPFARVLQEN